MFPDNAGLPMSGNTTGTQYVLMGVHFHNPMNQDSECNTLEIMIETSNIPHHDTS